MRVYIVTTGDPDSYSIRAVTEDKEKAKQYSEIFSDKNSHAVIETYETDNIGFDYTPGMILFEVALKPFTNCIDERKMSCERVSVATINESNYKLNKVYKLYDRLINNIPGFYVYLEAKTEEDALRSGTEMINKYLKEKENKKEN